LLEQVFGEVSNLSPKEQNVLSAWIIEELTSEGRWERTFAESSDLLNQLADKALTPHPKAKTQSLDPNNL
jgi:hypothetical protein